MNSSPLAGMCTLKKAISSLPLLFLAGSVHGLDNGECGPPEQIRAKLMSEGQHTLASANRIEREQGRNVMYGVAVTVNDDRSIGYIVKSDRELTEPPTKTCIYKRLADLRLFDARKPDIPQEALLKSPDADALSRCDALAKAGTFARNSCAPYNVTIRKGEPNGERIMLQGFNVERLADGTYKRDGTMTTVTGNVTGLMVDNPNAPWQGVTSGIFFTSLPDGATVINMTLAFAKYTEYGAKALAQANR